MLYTLASGGLGEREVLRMPTGALDGTDGGTLGLAEGGDKTEGADALRRAPPAAFATLCKPFCAMSVVWHSKCR